MKVATDTRTAGPPEAEAQSQPVPTSSIRAHLPALAGPAFVLLLAGLAVFRYRILLQGGAPATIDSGNWLAYGHALFGEHLRATSIVYPPVVPALVSWAVSGMGTARGVAIVSALSSLAPALAVYAVLRSQGQRWLAFCLAGLIAAAGATGEAAAWGGFPQLLGLGFGILFLWQLDCYLVSGRAAFLWRAALLLAMVAATSDLVTGGLAVAASVLTGLRLTVSRPAETPSRWRVLGHLWLILLPSLALVPLYAHIVQPVLANGAQQPPDVRLTPGNLPSHVEFIYRDFRLGWRVGLMAAVVSPLFLLDRRRDPLWVLSTALLVTVASTALGLREDRFLYLLPFAVVLALAAWQPALAGGPGDVGLRVARNGLGAVVAAALVVQVITGAHRFYGQHKYYGVLSPDVVAAIEWLHTSTSARSLVAVASVRNAPVGWWVEGLGHRLTLPATPLRWLNYADEKRRARLANAIFTSRFPDVTTLTLAAHDGAAYVLLSKDSDLISPDRLAEFESQHPRAIAFARPGAVVLRADPGVL